MRIYSSSKETWGSDDVRQATYSSSNVETIEDFLDHCQNLARVAGFGDLAIGSKYMGGEITWSQF
tara:strand:- start:2665 stop:2859 length:195 start_codon:yes stop_codon:yes gene_type:complete